MRRLWGTSDIHSRQKWNAIWPLLSQLPKEELRVLDAGCGSGGWALELAARRPGWVIVGIDKDLPSIERARQDHARLGLNNVRFNVREFLTFRPMQPYDVVLSISSAHYLAAKGLGPMLFERFASWLRPGGVLVLYGPRLNSERPLSPRLRQLSRNWGFGANELAMFSRHAGLETKALVAEVDFFGTAAKELAILTSGTAAGRLCTYPLQLALSVVGRLRRRAARASSAWLLIAAKPRDGVASAGLAAAAEAIREFCSYLA